MSNRIWFDRIVGAIVALLGVALVAPGTYVLLSHLFFYTVAWNPPWIPFLLIGMAVLGAIQIYGGVNMWRWAGRWS